MIAGVLVAAGVLAPVGTLIWHAAQGSFEHWRHLFDHVLPVAFLNTAILLAGVAVLVTALGVGAAWLITAYRFPGRSFLSWALLLPLAVPTYIVAFAYLDILHPIGPVQGLIRDILGYSSPREFRLPDLRSLPGALVLLGLVLYPYVYLSTRIMFATQAASLLEAARVLGESSRGVFLRVALPMARPAIAIGVSLALLEALNDIGASEFLGVQTLTVSVYTTWITRNDLSGAAQIALAMLAMVAMLVLLERRGRKRQRYASNLRARPVQPRQLRGMQALGATALGWTPVIIGFVAPALYLANETLKHLALTGSVSDQLLMSAWNTLKVALLATFFTLLCGLVVAWAARAVRHSDRPTLARACARIATSGYAIPGTVLAIGLLTPLIAFDGLISVVWSRISGADPSLWLMGSVGALVCAYVIRFLAISVGGMESGLARIHLRLNKPPGCWAKRRRVRCAGCTCRCCACAGRGRPVGLCGRHERKNCRPRCYCGQPASKPWRLGFLCRSLARHLRRRGSRCVGDRSRRSVTGGLARSHPAQTRLLICLICSSGQH